MLPFSGVASLRFDFLRVGSLRDAFLRVTLERYQQELDKDFKRITLYICTKSDYHLHECGGYLEDEEPNKASVLMLTILRILWLLTTQTSSNQGPVDTPLKNTAMLKIMKNLTVLR